MIETKSIDVEEMLRAKRVLDEKPIPSHVVMYSNPEAPSWFRRLFFKEDLPE